VKQNFNIGLDQAGADIGQPTSFYVGCALNLAAQDSNQEMKNLRRKLKAGADFILTQPIFQPEAGKEFLKRYRDQYGSLEVPLLVGIMPLFSLRHAAFLHNEVPGISIPEVYRKRLEKAERKGSLEECKSSSN
jgi:homocysteine S-methyltransferase